MGEYEDRYPDAYGRQETAGQPPAEAELHLPPRQHRQSSLFRTLFGTGAAAMAPPPRARADYRGLGPRGYIRSDQRIYEDICDRLTENPLIDASDVAVSVRDRTVTLAGSIDNLQALSQVEEIAREVTGVASVRNDLIVAGKERAPQLRDR
jgi:hypothetical protein